MAGKEREKRKTTGAPFNFLPPGAEDVHCRPSYATANTAVFGLESRDQDQGLQTSSVPSCS